MAGLLGKKFPAPIARVYWPFYTAGLIMAYGVNSAASALMAGDEFKNDPRNPAVRSGKNKADH